jgi:hypothetical protein
MDQVLIKQMEWEAVTEDERLRPDLAKVEHDFQKDYIRKIAGEGDPHFSKVAKKWL